jgi:hypothetical protein
MYRELVQKYQSVIDRLPKNWQPWLIVYAGGRHEIFIDDGEFNLWRDGTQMLIRRRVKGQANTFYKIAFFGPGLDFICNLRHMKDIKYLSDASSRTEQADTYRSLLNMLDQFFHHNPDAKTLINVEREKLEEIAAKEDADRAAERDAKYGETLSNAVDAAFDDVDEEFEDLEIEVSGEEGDEWEDEEVPPEEAPAPDPEADAAAQEAAVDELARLQRGTAETQTSITGQPVTGLPPKNLGQQVARQRAARKKTSKKKRRKRRRPVAQ